MLHSPGKFTIGYCPNFRTTNFKVWTVLSTDDILLYTSMKKHKFKKYLKQKLYQKAEEFLFKNKVKHSKSSNLNSFNLQEYLYNEELTTREKKLLFSLRTRSVHVKTNYRNMYKYNMQCTLCDENSEEESESHLLQCTKIRANLDLDTIMEIFDASYEQIFSQNIDQQIKITKIFAKVLKLRNILLKQK